MAKIIVNGIEITIISIEERDYISLTDMVKSIENGLAPVSRSVALQFGVVSSQRRCK